MVPSIGRIVHYTLTDMDAQHINDRRDALASERAASRSGVVLHTGNKALAGQVYPMLIIRTWGDEETSSVNGQVFLDGNDVYWTTSVGQGEGAGRWVEPKRV